MKLTTAQVEEAERDGLVLPERPLHTVWHFGKLYQWFRRMDGVHVMRPADERASLASVVGYYQVGLR